MLYLIRMGHRDTLGLIKWNKTICCDSLIEAKDIIDEHRLIIILNAHINYHYVETIPYDGFEFVLCEYDRNGLLIREYYVYCEIVAKKKDIFGV